MTLKGNGHIAKEKVSRTESRYVIVVLDEAIKSILVKKAPDHLFRTINLSNMKQVTVHHLKNFRHVVIKVTHHYDLYLIFGDPHGGICFYEDLEKFCKNMDLMFIHKIENRFSIMCGVTTVYDRQKVLTEFCRFVMQNVCGNKEKAKATGQFISINKGKITLNKKKLIRLFSIEITLDELANELGMLPDNIFVQQLFRLMDTDKNGFITIEEYWNVMVVLVQGKPEQKARLIFDIYDLTQSGCISASDLKRLVRSVTGPEVKESSLDKMVEQMMQSVGLTDTMSIDYEKFKEIFMKEEKMFKNASLDMRAKKTLSRTFSMDVLRQRNDEIDEEPERDDPPQSDFLCYYYFWVNEIRGKKQFVFWLVMYTIVMLLIFVERAYHFSVESEHGGLRRMAGYGVTVTRGAASAMMFTFSTLLITMCHNLFSMLRSTALHRLIPFDQMVGFHRYIGFWALVWTVVHVIGHAINFYHISTQTPQDLTCLFRDFYRSTDALPKFQYWCWSTITGVTGVLLTVQTAVIYVYAYFGRKNFFRDFWSTHNTYPIFYALFVLHGSGMLVQRPFFHFFFLGPCVLFTLDKLVSVSKSKISIDVVSVVKLPSDVIRLEFHRPPNFSFQSGQWVKIASKGISEQEYHPFTLSSAPHEENLTVHIRAVGPWTRKLYEVYTERDGKYPEIFMDGPFGEGHQTWWDYEVVVMVAGGIGVTPFASILKDIANKLQHSKRLFTVKKVLFLWITRSQKQYEWMIDILHEVEASDSGNVIGIHIFITQYKSKFDLRTIMLYMADRHYHRGYGTSLFTQLQAITHFSRPNFVSIFKSVKQKHRAKIIGVFTCGSSAISHSVEKACKEMNMSTDVIFRHYYKNF